MEPIRVKYPRRESIRKRSSSFKNERDRKAKRDSLRSSKFAKNEPIDDPEEQKELESKLNQLLKT